MKKYLTPKFIIPALAVFLMAAGYTFLQSPRGQVILRCYAAFDIAPIADGNEITCPDGEVVTPVAQITPTPAGATGSPTPLKTSTLSVTGTQARGSATPTKTLTPAKTNTPAPTLPGVTATKPASTPTAGATVTPGASPTPRPTQPGGIILGDDGCLVENRFHGVEVGTICRQYHTGADMRAPENQKLFDTFAYPGLVNQILDTYGDVYQEDFVSSLAEIPHHYRGFKWILDINEDCDQYEGGTQDFSGWACIVYSANRIHDDGTIEHALSRYHSAFFIRTVCGKGADGVWQKTDITPANCGVEYAPQLMDFGEYHLKYKDIWNPIPGTDSNCFSYPNSPPDLLDGGLYRITNNEARAGKPPISGWWGQPPNASEADCYHVNEKNETPNAGNTITWMSTAWQIYKGEMSGFPIEDQKDFARTLPPAVLGGNHTYTIINARTLFQVPVPFNGWIDQWGHVKQSWECSDGISSNCFPLVIVGNYPTVKGLSQQAILQRRSNPNSLLDCILSPCLTYAEPGEEVFPYFDNPTGEIVEPHH